MARFEDMLPDARSGLPGAADFTILAALRRSAAELCRQSEVWRVRLDPFNTQPNVAQYDLDPPSGARVARVLWAKYNGADLEPKTEDEIDGYDAATGAPYRFAQSTSAQTILLWPTPGSTDSGALAIRAVLVPTPNASTFPDDLAIAFRPGIVAMAKAELMAVSPGMPYHNPAEAQVQAAIGNEWISAATRRRANGAMAVPLRAAPRRFV